MHLHLSARRGRRIVLIASCRNVAIIASNWSTSPRKQKYKSPAYANNWTFCGNRLQSPGATIAVVPTSNYSVTCTGARRGTSSPKDDTLLSMASTHCTGEKAALRHAASR